MNTTIRRKRLIAASVALFAVGGLTIGALPSQAAMKIKREAGGHSTVAMERRTQIGPFNSEIECEAARTGPSPGTTTADHSLSECYKSTYTNSEFYSYYYYDKITRGGGAEPAHPPN